MIKLEWVSVNDQIVHVSSLSAAPLAERRAARCPACRERVTLRLGSIKAHHAAHQAGSSCATTAPETAIHVNSKYYLAAQLRLARELHLLERCAHPACTEVRTLPRWQVGWTDVEVEHSIGTRRPDVVLLRDGGPVAAVEVRVSHAVDQAKADALKSLGVPWTEVMGSAGLYSGDHPWKFDRPLPVQAGDWEAWLCHACGLRAAREKEAEQVAQQLAIKTRETNELRLAEVVRLIAEAKQGGWLPYRVRVFDLYFRNRKRARDALVFGAIHAGGKPVLYELRRRSHDLALELPVLKGDALGSRVEEAAGRIIGYAQGMQVDLPMWWLNPVAVLFDNRSFLAHWVGTRHGAEFLDRARASSEASRLSVGDALISYILPTLFDVCPQRMWYSFQDRRWCLPKRHAKAEFTLTIGTGDSYEYVWSVEDEYPLSFGFGSFGANL